jgi:phospholipase/carboxylesterase
MRHSLVDDVVMIALHGVAHSKSEVEQITAPLKRSFRLNGVRWVFPRAPWRRLTLLGGRPALAWYDLFDKDRSSIDREGLEAATSRLCERIASHAAERDSRSIVLAGFSQGGALALHTALRMGASLAGVVAVSAALPSLEEIAATLGRARVPVQGRVAERG